MSGLVLDASVAFAFVAPDEGDPLPTTTELLETEGAIVTASWRLEIANALLLAQRRGRIDSTLRRQALFELGDMPISIDGETNQHAWEHTLTLAERYNLSTYDAAYLELALRSNLPLATLDEDLRAGARRERVKLLD
ncbi:MAG TPA: type II toxin-antitoxin system VapC family toxin [Rhizomicrobium sp.]|nr:type II toxin-antitoxin system VapC family toxin [Rhizomicrobium sp.]